MIKELIISIYLLFRRKTKMSNYHRFKEPNYLKIKSKSNFGFLFGPELPVVWRRDLAWSPRWLIVLLNTSQTAGGSLNSRSPRQQVPLQMLGKLDGTFGGCSRTDSHWLCFCVSAVSHSAGTTETRRRWALGTWNPSLTTVGWRRTAWRTQHKHLNCCCWCQLNAAQSQELWFYFFCLTGCQLVESQDPHFYFVVTQVHWVQTLGHFLSFSLNKWLSSIVQNKVSLWVYIGVSWSFTQLGHVRPDQNKFCDTPLVCIPPVDRPSQLMLTTAPLWGPHFY